MGGLWATPGLSLACIQAARGKGARGSRASHGACDCVPPQEWRCGGRTTSLLSRMATKCLQAGLGTGDKAAGRVCALWNRGPHV